MNKTVDWYLKDRELNKLDHRNQVRFALRCGSICYFDRDSLAVIDAVEGWLEGRVSESEVDSLITEKMRFSRTGSEDDVACLIAETVLTADSHSHLSASYAAESAWDVLRFSAGSTPEGCEMFREDLMRYLWELVNVDSVIETTVLGAV